jgi:hypothetical protein
MIARLLHLCGLDLGPREMLLHSDGANPLGHFEHRGFLRIDRKLLKHFGATWYEPPELEPGWEHDPQLEPLVGEAKMLVATFPPLSAWGWKEPRSALFLPFWKEVIPNMRFVICLRSPLEVARSLEERNRISIEKGASLWYRYTRDSLEDTNGCPRILTFFEDFFGAGFGEIDRVIEFCGLQKPEASSETHRAVAAELRHHSSEIPDLLKESRVSRECKLLYIGLRALLSPHFVPAGSSREQQDRISAAVGDFMKLFKERSELRNTTGPSGASPVSTPTPLGSRTFKTLKKFFRALRGS